MKKETISVSKVQKIYEENYSIKKIFLISWKIFMENFLSIVIILSIVYIPVITIFIFTDMFTNFLSIFTGIFTTLPIIYIVKQSIDNKKIELKKILLKSLSTSPIAIFTIILKYFILFIFFIFAAPIIIYGEINIISLISLLFATIFIVFYDVYWVFVIQAIVFHDKFWKSALDYSRSIVENRWWKVFGCLFVFSSPILAFLLFPILVFTFLTLFDYDFIIFYFDEKIIKLFDYNKILTIGLFSAISIITGIIFSYSTIMFTVFFIKLDKTKIVKKLK